MAARPQRKRKPKPKSDSFETTSTVIGVAFSMPDTSILASLPEPPPIDFQARQDSISEKRRAPGKELAKADRHDADRVLRAALDDAVGVGEVDQRAERLRPERSRRRVCARRQGGGGARGRGREPGTLRSAGDRHLAHGSRGRPPCADALGGWYAMAALQFKPNLKSIGDPQHRRKLFAQRRQWAARHDVSEKMVDKNWADLKQFLGV